MLSAYSDPARIRDALTAGAAGYMLKDASPDELVQGIRAAAEGVAPFDRRIAAAMVAAPNARQAPRLSARELDVLRLVSTGVSNREIAESLHIAEKTVKAHMTRIFNSLGVKSRTAAAVRARELGYVPDEMGVTPDEPESDLD